MKKLTWWSVTLCSHIQVCVCVFSVMASLWTAWYANRNSSLSCFWIAVCKVSSCWAKDIQK